MSAYSLGKLKDERALNVLIGGLKDESRAVRYHCVAALSNFPKVNSANALSTVLHDPEIRIHAISSLIKIGEVAVPSMIKTLKSKDQLDAGGAAAVLGRIGSDKAVNPLIEALSRPELEVTRQANAALRMITKQSFGDDIEAWKNWSKTQK
jgi:HEAT repeat protein